jgi:hypothetical protein
MITNSFFHLTLFPLLFAVANLYGFSFMILYNVCTFDVKFEIDWFRDKCWGVNWKAVLLPEFKEALQPWIFRAVTYTTNCIFLVSCYNKDLSGWMFTTFTLNRSKKFEHSISMQHKWFWCWCNKKKNNNL